MSLERLSERGCRALLGSVSALAMLATIGSPARSQSATGSWEAGFDHSITAPTATDFLAPFGGAGFAGPPASGLIFPMFGWGWQPSHHVAQRFNAIHSALIPKGSTRHRGKVLVWNRYPVVFRPGAPFDSNNYWVFQAWSIVDTSPTAVPRFRNFVLPLQSFGTTPPPQTPPTAPVTIRVADLFCSGHAWSQHGDLVVAGGAKFDVTVDPTQGISATDLAARYLFLFDPDTATSPFPLQAAPTSPLYPGEFGAWMQQTKQAGGVEELHSDRYYPTVTLSQVMTRNNLNNEVVMVSGGSDPAATSNIPQNTYETWIVRRSGHVNGFFQQDSPANQPGYGTFGGTQPNLEMDWLQEYPRLHLWGDGTMFNSGYAYKPGRVNMQQVPNAPWDLTLGQTGSNWQSNRKEGTSVHFAKLGAFYDLVVRLCGSGTLGTTATSEVIIRSPALSWTSLGSVPPGIGRGHTNAVILPCGSIIVIGGDNPSPSPNGTAVLTTAMYINGVGWHSLPAAADSPTPRRYHATALLLEDGRVFVGGGEGRGTGTDYDIFRPWYLQGNPPPARPSIVSITNGPPNTVANVDDTWILSNNLQGLTLTASFGVNNNDAVPTEYLARLVLIAPGSITHHSDMTARYVELDSALVAGTTDRRVFNVPDGNVLPRGYYMLFALNNANVPSVADWVLIQ